MKTLQWLQVQENAVKVFVSVALLFVAGTLAFPVTARNHVDVQRTRVVQVALDEKPKISQYLDIDSTPTGYGKNACGLVAAAAAVGGQNWTRLVGSIATAAGSNYQRESGIQPSKYVSALKRVFGTANTSLLSDSSVEQLYDELAAGNVVIVDLKVNETTQTPSAEPPNYAHFARVLGIDMTRQEIYIENTIDGAAYWTMSLRDFSAAWSSPETTASDIPDPLHVEDVTNWAVVLDRSLVGRDDL